MRKIKFRGKQIDNGEWVVGYYWHDSLDNRHLITVLEWCRSGWNIEVEPKTVGQYTGLKDKNGVEVYEGDIVKATRYDGLAVTGVVGFRDCSFVISTGYQTIYTWIDYQIEAIGNIYEQPELLKESENE